MSKALSPLVALLVLAAVPHLHSQAPQPSSRPAWAWKPSLAGANDGQVHILPVRGRVSMLVGAGGNITVSAGNDGVMTTWVSMTMAGFSWVGSAGVCMPPA